jgi:hypothetical protein
MPAAVRDRIDLDPKDLKARIGGRIVALLRGPVN